MGGHQVKHECTGKMVDTKSYFRYENIIINGVSHGMAYGKYGVCRGCKQKVKVMTRVHGDGRITETILRVGGSMKTKSGEIKFTEEEAMEIK